ncbi:MAG: hypothetical protein WB019_14890, partial [Pseudolabrys sp.]
RYAAYTRHWPWSAMDDSCSRISTKTSVSREARGECVDILEVVGPNRNVVTCELLKYRRVRG